VSRAGLAIFLCLVMVSRAHAGRATCSNPGLPVGATASSDLLPGQLTVGLTTGILPLESTELLDEAQGPLRYESRFVLVETRLSAALAVTPWLAVEGALPYRVVNVDVTYRDPTTGAEVPLQGEAIHARDETIRGLGDPSLGVHVAEERGPYHLHLRAGTSLPLGGTEENPFLLGMIGQQHQHVQLGTGTFIPTVAVEVQRAFGRVTAGAFALTHQSLYENGERYRAGDRYSGGLSASSALGTRRFSFSAAAEVHAETAEEWAGVTYEDEGNAGRTDVLVGGAVAWRPRAGLALVGDVKVPVYQHVVGPQLDYPAVFGASVVATFETRKRASWAGLDHAVLGPAGSAAPLTPVPGKITVMDLWATWCAPCRELDRGLAALARKHPARLAVRKLDVTDTESEAWAAYLEPGQFALPHLKVFGADGALIFERTAPPAELLRAVEALLE
jgi:thiol-disulfide isomerase/thioredoxin